MNYKKNTILPVHDVHCFTEFKTHLASTILLTTTDYK